MKRAKVSLNMRGCLFYTKVISEGYIRWPMFIHAPIFIVWVMYAPIKLKELSHTFGYCPILKVTWKNEAFFKPPLWPYQVHQACVDTQRLIPGHKTRSTGSSCSLLVHPLSFWNGYFKQHSWREVWVPCSNLCLYNSCFGNVFYPQKWPAIRYTCVCYTHRK